MMKTSSLKLAALLFCVGNCLLLVGCKKKPDITSLPYLSTVRDLSSDAFALVFLSNLEGLITPCGCSSNPLGGIDRFTTVYNNLKALSKGNIGIIDTGNLLFDQAQKSTADICHEEAKIDLLLSSLTHLGLSITTPHGFDDAHGAAFRNQVYKKHKLASLSNNEMHVITTPAYAIGVVAITEAQNKEHERARLKKLIESQKMRHNIKATVAISLLPLQATKDLLFEASMIDVVIQADTQRFAIPSPIRISPSGPLLLEGGRQGQYATIVAFENLGKRQGPLVYDDSGFAKNNREELLKSRIAALEQQKTGLVGERLIFIEKRIKLAHDELLLVQNTAPAKKNVEPTLSFHAIALTKKIEPDKEIQQKLSDYEKNLPMLTKKCEEHLDCPKLDAKQASYVGAQTCKACHQEAFTVWMKSQTLSRGKDDRGQEITRTLGHSKAWKTLADMDKDSDRSCIGCHSIGFMEPGGYCKTTEVSFRKDVQCESCHGAGSLHAQSGDKKLIKRQVPEETCRSCHHVPHIDNYESFNYEERLIKILGKGHGEQLLKTIEHKKKSSK